MDSSERSSVALSVAGSGQPEYEARVRALVSRLQLDGAVTFLGKVARDAMARTYAEHDVLVFPSMRDEGLPLTMVEAMLSGCAVVTTGSGGAMDVVQAADLPLFPKGDSAALRTLLRSFVAGPDQVAALTRRGQRVALDQFSFAGMMAKWADLLGRLHRNGSRAPSGRSA
jgi:glycosyltransferase involved in cell wall biosynthesis